MKNIFFIIVIISIAFISCDGRKSRSEALKASVEEFNEKQSESEIITYYPKEYTEVVSDTLISNKVKVHIKNYSLLNESIVMLENYKSIPNSNKQHRVFESEIVVSTPSKEILNIHISAKQFKSSYSDEFWNHATLQHVWVNQDLSTINDIKLDMSFINPSNNSYKFYRMSIDEHGQQRIELIEERT